MIVVDVLGVGLVECWDSFVGDVDVVWFLQLLDGCVDCYCIIVY